KEVAYVLGVVLAVGVHRDHDVVALGQRIGEAGFQRFAFALVFLETFYKDSRSGSLARGFVGRPIIDDENVIDELPRGRHDRADSALFIEGWAQQHAFSAKP